MWGLERAVDYNSSPVIGRIAHVRQGRRVGAGMAPVVASSEIYVAALDGTNVVRVSNRPGNDHWPPSWSADGRCLTWQGDDHDSNDNFASDIIVAALDGGEPINVTADTGFGELFPDWSPGTCPL
jgi:hypothetical protein